MSHFRCPKCLLYNTIVINDATIGFEYDDEVSIEAEYQCCNIYCQHKGHLKIPYQHIDLDDVIYDEGE